jgi:hypothetical protein
MAMLWLSLILAAQLGHASPCIAPHFSILQGATSSSTAHFTVVARDYEALTFSANADSSHRMLKPAQVDRIAQSGSRWVVYRLHFEDLDFRRHYRLNVYNARGELADQRGFHMLNPDKLGGKLAFGSCMVRQFHNPFMWNALERERPDLILLIGDSVYLDHENLLFVRRPKTTLDVWQSFVESRNRLNLFFWRELSPIVTVWDDHDSGFNNDDAKFTLMPKVRGVLETFFANEAIHGELSRGPGMAKQFQMFGRNIILLDGRSFRGTDSTSPLFGTWQENWLKDHIRPGLNFILSGSQFYGGFIKKDSLEFNWPEYAARFTRSLKSVADKRGASLVFGSGDVHFSEVQVLEPELFGYETYEITSSSIHSFAFPGHYLLKPRNPRRRRVTGTHNAVILDFADQPGAPIQVRSLGWRGNELFRFEIPAKLSACERWLKVDRSSLRRTAEMERF